MPCVHAHIHICESSTDFPVHPFFFFKYCFAFMKQWKPILNLTASVGEPLLQIEPEPMILTISSWKHCIPFSVDVIVVLVKQIDIVLFEQSIVQIALSRTNYFGFWLYSRMYTVVLLPCKIHGSCCYSHQNTIDLSPKKNMIELAVTYHGAIFHVYLFRHGIPFFPLEWFSTRHLDWSRLLFINRVKAW